MKTIFPYPIGDLRKLGTRKQWTCEVAGFVLGVAGMIVLLIIL